MPDYRKQARRAARRHGIDAGVFERQIYQESRFDPNARSPAGARGIAQITPDTARAWGVDPSDPIASLDAAAKNMSSYVKQYGGYENALRAYNAGPGAIEKSKSYAETNNYVRTILGGSSPKALAPRRSSTGTRPRVALPAQRLVTGKQTVFNSEPTTTFDDAGYERAQRLQKVALLLRKSGRGKSVLFKSGLLSADAPDPAAFTRRDYALKPSTVETSQLLPGVAGARVPGMPRAAAAPSSKSVQAAINTAAKYLGIRESAGPNRGPEVDKLQRTFGFVGAAWCGIYIGNVLKQVGVRGVDSRIASVAEIERMARNKTGAFRGGWHSAASARAGDALVTVQGEHVVFVTGRNKDGTIRAIGGNTGNGAVERRTYRPDQVFGVARPHYRK